MAFTLTYRTLFEIDVWHHFFLDDQSGNFVGMSEADREKVLNGYQVQDFIDIQPTLHSANLFKGHQLIFKKTSTGILLASKADPFDTSKMFNPLVDGQIIRFVISAKSNSFNNYTNSQAQSGDVYYFNNHTHQDSEYPALSQIPPVFDAVLAASMAGDGDPNTFAYPSGAMLVNVVPNPKTLKIASEATNADFANAVWKKDTPAQVYDGSTTYNAGDRVLFTQAGTDSIFEAIEETSGNDPSDAIKWNKITDLPLTYVNKNDQVPWLSNSFSYTIPNAGSNYQFDVVDQLDQVLLSKSRTSETDAELFQLDLGNLPTSNITIRVTDVIATTVVDQYTGVHFHSSDLPGQPVGLIEIMAFPSAGVYQILDNNDAFQQPRYEIRFKNRATVWQYFNNEENLVVASPEALPLLFRGYQKITHDGVDLPNPNAEMIRPTPQQTYSEIFI